MRGHASVAALLVGAGADANVRDEDGWTPLLWAAGKPYGDGSAATVEVLLAAGCSVDVRAHGGETAIDNAGSPEIVRRLLEAGAVAEGSVAETNDTAAVETIACSIAAVGEEQQQQSAAPGLDTDTDTDTELRPRLQLQQKARTNCTILPEF